MSTPRFVELLTRIFTNKSKDLFTVRLGAKVLLAKYGVAGIMGEVIALPLRGVLGLLIEEGIFLIDSTTDLVREGMKIPEFEKLAFEAWREASAGIKTEEEKEVLRDKFLDIISGIGVVGNPNRLHDTGETSSSSER